MADGRRRQSGFTLIELMTVLGIISILMAIAVPQYKLAIIQAREAVLKEDLYRIRDLIDQYWVDKGKYPGSLQALVEDGYLRALPKDPITQSTEWEEVLADPDPDNPGAPTGISDVHSTSKNTSLDGTTYSEW